MIHPSAVVNPDSQIDPSVEIGPYCTIGPHVKIGPGTKLISHVVVEGDTEIGQNNTIYPFAVIGAIPQDLKYKGEPTKVRIGNHNSIRESCTINLGTVQGGGVTQLGDHNLLMGYAHLGHDCTVGNHCILANYAGLAGHVILEDYASLTGMVGVGQFVRVGAHAYVGAFSAVDRDIPPFTISVGIRPPKIKGANIVGLRRRGFKAEKIQIINEAIKLWRPDVQKDQCLLEIESQYGEVPEIQQFIKFVKETKVGVSR